MIDTGPGRNGINSFSRISRHGISRIYWSLPNFSGESGPVPCFATWLTAIYHCRLLSKQFSLAPTCSVPSNPFRSLHIILLQFRKIRQARCGEKDRLFFETKVRKETRVRKSCQSVDFCSVAQIFDELHFQRH